jgi:tetratricopeptide (TPR) repeat protein
MAGLGTHQHKIATTSAEAQILFNQGLTLVYGFNHGRAIQLFQRAAELDRRAPMPLWGIALAYGPNINDFEMDRERAKTADEFAKKALALTSPANPRERAYVQALAKRYSSDPAADLKKLQVDYKDAMAALAKAYPSDLDAQVLYAESLMDLRPWQLWTRDGKPSDVTEEVVRVLESVLERNPNHPGANHYYIHTMEGSPAADKALAAAQRLETLVPAAGHLVHMPAHIWMRTGEYQAAVKTNADAALLDEKYVKATGATGLYPTMYYGHNLQFESAAAMFSGNFAAARAAGQKTAALVAPMAGDMAMLQPFTQQEVFALVRFDRWDDVLAQAAPPADRALQTALYHFARGAAHAGKGHAAEALEEQAAFEAAAAKVPKDGMYLTINSAPVVLDVARADLAARIADAQNDGAKAVAAWKVAVAAEDKVSYDEPPA